MTDELERRWDDEVERAWSEFRQRIADRLAEMGSGETLLVELPQDDEMVGCAPYCQVMSDEGNLRLEAVSNEFLDPSHELDGEQHGTLVGLGFEEPEDDASPNFFVDLEQREADRAAVMMVRALQEVYGVLHPVYLDAAGLEPRPVAADGGSDDPGEDRMTFPEDADDVRRALTDALQSMFENELQWDDDGDLPVVTERCVLYVTLARRSPRILMHATLLVDVVDRERALLEVNLLNKEEFGLTFLCSEGRVSVRRELPVGAFVPQEIRAEIQRLCDGLDTWTTDLQARVGGKGVFDEGTTAQPLAGRAARPEAEAPQDARLQQALRVLRELEGEERGSVDPQTMLRIFHSDRDLLLDAIRHSLSRASYWGKRRRQSEEEGKHGYAKLCRSRQRYHLEVRGRQRRALRLAVQAGVKRDRAEQLALFSEDEAAGS